MLYILGKLWHLAIIWPIRKAFQCILQGVRILPAKYTRISPTSENDSYGQNSRGRGRESKCRFMQTLCPIYPHWHLSIFIYFNVYILTFLRLGNMRQECPGPSLKVRLVLVKYNYVFFGCLSDPRAIVVLLCP